MPVCGTKPNSLRIYTSPACRVIDYCETACGPVVFVELVGGRSWSRISADEMPLAARFAVSPASLKSSTQFISQG
ncbi:MAG UNVERIFIED_CONTAM: hypothetical protein LVR18_52425 [Planctomycetaceae bacterium]